jgi:hypothetical protein
MTADFDYLRCDLCQFDKYQCAGCAEYGEAEHQQNLETNAYWAEHERDEYDDFLVKGKQMENQINESNEESLTPPQWALVEILGHRAHVGIIRECTQYGVTGIEIIVPGLPAIKEARRPSTLEERRNWGFYDDDIKAEMVLEESPEIPEEKFFYAGAALYGVHLLEEQDGITRRAHSVRARHWRMVIEEEELPLLVGGNEDNEE